MPDQRMPTKRIRIEVPGRGSLSLTHLVLDLNGTLTCDGQILPGVLGRVTALRERLEVCLLTADTRGQGRAVAATLGIPLACVEPGDEATQKARFVHEIGPDCVAAIGNGAIDAEMLRAAALGIAVLGSEGLAVSTLCAADVLVADVLSAFDLLLQPLRLLATLRC